MAGFKPESPQPEYADLITSLVNSGQQTKNNALFQTVYLLLQRLTKSKNLFEKDLKDLQDFINKLGNVTFLTQDDETIFLPNSRQLLASLGIQFDDTIPGERTIRLDHYWTPLTDGSKTEANLIYANGEAIAVEVPNIAPYTP